MFIAFTMTFAMVFSLAHGVCGMQKLHEPSMLFGNRRGIESPSTKRDAFNARVSVARSFDRNAFIKSTKALDNENEDSFFPLDYLYFDSLCSCKRHGGGDARR